MTKFLCLGSIVCWSEETCWCTECVEECHDAKTWPQPGLEQHGHSTGQHRYQTNPNREPQVIFEFYSIITVKLIFHHLIPSNTQITRKQVLRLNLHYNFRIFVMPFSISITIYNNTNYDNKDKLLWMDANVYLTLLTKNFLFGVQLVPALTTTKHSLVILERQEI